MRGLWIVLDSRKDSKVSLTLRDKMTREQLKKWFDKLPNLGAWLDEHGDTAARAARVVTWEDIKNLARRIEATKEDK